MDKVDIIEYQNLSEPVCVTVVTGLLNIPDTGVPKGGKKGQNLTKKSDSDFDTYWADPDDINSIEHITLNDEEVPIEDKTAHIKVDAKTIGLESTNVAYTDKDNTFTEPQTFSYGDPEYNDFEYAEVGGGSAHYNYTQYTDDTHKYSTSREAYISAATGRISMTQDIRDESGVHRNSLTLDVRHNWIACVEIDAPVGSSATSTYYVYKLPKTHPNVYTTLATIEDLTAQFGALNIENGSGKEAIQQKQDGTTGTFDFTGKNPNATALDPTLTGQIPYGATGDFAASFGGKGAAQGKRAFQKGTNTIAKGNYSSVEGSDNAALGPASHVEGYMNTSGPLADSAHVEGGENIVLTPRGHAEGYKNQVNSMNAHAEGENNVIYVGAEASHAEGTDNDITGLAAHGEGQKNTVSSVNGHAENTLNVVSGDSSHGEGYGNEVDSYAAHVEGSGNKILKEVTGGDEPGPTPPEPTPGEPFDIDKHLGYNSHVEGTQNLNYGYSSHTEGSSNKNYSHYGHAEGYGNIAGSWDSDNEKSVGQIVHVEGNGNTATGDFSHAQNHDNKATGKGATVMGQYSESAGLNTIALGTGVRAIDDNSIGFGTYNDPKSGQGVMATFGYGTSNTDRKNAIEVMRDGRVKFPVAPVDANDAVRLHELGDYVKYTGVYYGNKIVPRLYFEGGQTYIDSSGLYVVNYPYHVKYMHNSISVGIADDTWTLKFPNHAGTFALVSDVDAKYDKTGGTIGGDVIITGDLTVNGTQHINNTENLNVENAMIYSNAKGATLATNGGIGIKKNATDVYGIVYDPTSDSVKLGLGKSDANGAFTFNAGEGQPVAIRDDSNKFNDNHLVKWDADNNKLVDSGYLVSDFVDVATQQTIGGIKTFTDEVHFNGVVEHYGNVNITDYILKILDTGKDLVTQYRSDGVTVENGMGESAIQYDIKFPLDSGTLLLNKFKYSKFSSDDEKDLWLLTDATKSIEMRYQDDVSYASMLVEKDYVEMSDVSDSGTSKVALASNFITMATEDTEGNHKLVHVSPERVAIGNGTTDYLLEIDSLSAKFSKRPQVKDNGNYVDVAIVDDLKNYVPTQSESNDKYYAQVTNDNGVLSIRVFQDGSEDVQNLIIDKDGVKVLGKNVANTEQLTNKVDKLSSSLINQAYVRNADGKDTGLAYTYTDEGGTLAVRNASGQLQVSDPSQDKDAANKSYADNLNARYVSTSILGG